MFAATGVPAYIRTDVGPQFSARLTREFFRRWGVDHQQSTPHYPQSNGHAEAAVKAVKRLVQKTTAGGDLNTDDFTAGLQELRNTPRTDGRSPEQILYGHPLRSAVPVHHRTFAQRWREAADDCDTKAAELLERSVERCDESEDNVATSDGQNHGVDGPDDGAAGALPSEHLTCPDDAGDEDRSALSTAEPEVANDSASPSLIYVDRYERDKRQYTLVMQSHRKARSRPAGAAPC
ncbi:uncharacterized protein LOC119094929 [Pollicipes pollicipes]|uniref:uncharacterized protein LOC119094929 n=1 Tax=Pollicipes pollicipes TaxID=41117 RepID=UPI0018857076|nr:uncharacterized protein LOC119094929 [Pollicipes pollicipes]